MVHPSPVPQVLMLVATILATPLTAQGAMRHVWPSPVVLALFHDTDRLAAAQGSVMAPAFLLEAILRRADLSPALERALGSEAVGQLRHHLAGACTSLGHTEVSLASPDSPNADLARLWAAAEQEAIDDSADQIRPFHLLRALLRTPTEALTRLQPEPLPSPAATAVLDRAVHLLSTLDSTATLEALENLPDMRILEQVSDSRIARTQ